MTALSVTQATQGLLVTRAIKSRWLLASRKEDGSCEMAPSHSGRRARFLIPWRRAAEARAEAELMHRAALAEEQLASLKTALDDMRAQREAWQAMSQARIRGAIRAGPVAMGFGQPDDEVKSQARIRRHATRAVELPASRA